MGHSLIKKLRLENCRRVICISDIHGHLAHLNRLLDKVGFCGDDFLIVIGDAIESGEASLGALRRVMELVKSGNAVMLAGNWDYFMHIWLTSDDPAENADLLKRTLELDDYYGSSLFSDMCREMGTALTPESDMRALLAMAREKFAEEIAFMGELPLILDCGDFVCVHGGVPTLDEAELAKLDPYSFLKNDAFAEQGHVFDRWLITGHWPVANYDHDIACFAPHIYRDSRIAAIDGGCGKQEAAQLNALMMRIGNPGKFETAYVDDFPRAIALESQAASENPLHTVWNTRFIDVIEKSGEFAKVLHHATGRILDVPQQRLWVQNGKEVLGDYTDYVLPIEKGDVISVLFETERGLCCKKGSVSGWYYGKYEKIEG